jgi:hypothetical protein
MEEKETKILCNGDIRKVKAGWLSVITIEIHLVYRLLIDGWVFKRRAKHRGLTARWAFDDCPKRIEVSPNLQTT